MKKKMIQLLAAALLLAFTCVPALAAEELKVNVLKDHQSTVSAEVKGADRIELTYTGTSGTRQYLVTAQADDGEITVPTEENLVYIDQAAASGGKVSFLIYPKALVEGQVYSIYLSSNAASGETGIRDYTQVALFGLGLKGDSDIENVVMGDVDGDENHAVTAADAAMVLDFSVKNKTPDESQAAAADVDRDGQITASDAAQILDFSVKNITEFKTTATS